MDLKTSFSARNKLKRHCPITVMTDSVSAKELWCRVGGEVKITILIWRVTVAIWFLSTNFSWLTEQRCGNWHPANTAFTCRWLFSTALSTHRFEIYRFTFIDLPLEALPRLRLLRCRSVTAIFLRLSCHLSLCFVWEMYPSSSHVIY